MSETAPVEILVHISASCGARDDERYRAQVSAILGFEAATRTHYPCCSHGDSDNDTDLASSLSDRDAEAVSRTSSHRGIDEAETRPGGFDLTGHATDDERLRTVSGHLAHGVVDVQNGLFEVHARRSSQDISRLVDAPGSTSQHATPQLRQLQLDQAEQIRCEANSLSSPVSVIPDSQPEIDGKESRLQEDVSARRSADNIPSCGLDGTASPLKKRSHEKISAESRRLDQHAEKRAKAMSASRDWVESVPEGSGRGTSALHTPTDSSTTSTSKLPQPTTSSRRQPLPPAHLSRRTIPLNALPMLIQPPPPPISTLPFTTHITPTLDMLTRRLRPDRIYSPVLQTRDLDPLERGYWRIEINLVNVDGRVMDMDHQSPPVRNGEPTSHAPTADAKGGEGREEEEDRISPNNWDISFFSTFWSFLADIISEGRAGWGVWCILEKRERNPSSPEKEKEKERKENKRTQDEDKNENENETISNYHSHSRSHSFNPANLNLTLKVYTWGEVAVHVYLLLFLASERRVRDMGLQWRDAKEDVVVQMPTQIHMQMQMM